jgi:hypothetical protein
LLMGILIVATAEAGRRAAKAALSCIVLNPGMIYEETWEIDDKFVVRLRIVLLLASARGQWKRRQRSERNAMWSGCQKVK